ncbi:MAG: formate--tetrahydrofolate ligase, partial [Pseudomonadota bacterium]
GGVAKADLGTENVAAVSAGCSNLGRHIENMKKFGVPIVVGINYFNVTKPDGTVVKDTEAEIQAIKDFCAGMGVDAVLNKHWADGGKGIAETAEKIVALCEGGTADYKPLYGDEMGLFEKIETVCREVYRADNVIADQKIKDQLKAWEAAGYGHFPVCMAKTQYSFTTDPAKRGAPTGFDIPVREVRLSAGAGFIVVVCGEIMTMPGLPRTPAAETIRLDESGDVQGLF